MLRFGVGASCDVVVGCRMMSLLSSLVRCHLKIIFKFSRAVPLANDVERIAYRP